MLSFDHFETEDLSLIRQSIEEFCSTHIAPQADALDNSDDFPKGLWQQLGELGLLGITVAPEYGGSDLGYLAQIIAMEEISRASASIGLIYGVHSNLVANHLSLHASEDQKQRYLPSLCTGEKVGALAMSEPNAGSDVVSMKLRAIKEDQYYRLNGNKMWITNGPDADIYIVYAKTAPDEGSHGISAFIIERDSPGFTRAQKLDKLGMRGAHTCELVFQDCLVPVENLIGNENEGVAILMAGLDFERTVLAAGPVGIMRACLDLALPYSRERKQFGQAIGQFQLIQAKLADMYTQLSACRCYLYSVARNCDLGKITREDSAGVILYCAERATQMALDAIQILGGNGYINEYSSGRLLRDAKLYEIGAGTSEIRRLLIGRELFERG